MLHTCRAKALAQQVVSGEGVAGGSYVAVHVANVPAATAARLLQQAAQYRQVMHTGPSPVAVGILAQLS